MRNEFLGCPVDVLNMRETVELAQQSMKSRLRLQHVALNVAKLVNMRSDPVLASDVASSDLVGVDGMGIVWAARLLGLRISERVSGIDLFNELLKLCAEEGFRPYFLGATPEVLELCRERILQKHPQLRFAGLRDGYFTAGEEHGVVRDIRNSGADCLFIGMPTPRKERFLAAYRDQLNVPFIMGVGGSFDVLSGKIRRAPARMQAFGLEWLYRVYQEPRRMWWRYARTNTLFGLMLARAVIAHRVYSLFGRDVSPAGPTRSSH